MNSGDHLLSFTESCSKNLSVEESPFGDIPMAGTSLWQGSPYGRDLPMAGISKWQGSPYGRDLPMEGISLWQGSPYGRGLPMAARTR